MVRLCGIVAWFGFNSVVMIVSLLVVFIVVLLMFGLKFVA